MGGIPGDPTGNGGGFVFDCRNLPNPGRIPEMMDSTGFDREVIEYLNSHREVSSFIKSASELVKSSANNYLRRGFKDLYVAFGCTGGRHRSVYCTNLMAKILSAEGFNVRTIHWQMESEEGSLSARHAMILAAGEGKRLAPLTDNIPKALVKAGGQSLLDLTVKSLNDAGFNNLTINTYHLADKMEKYLKDISEQNPAVKFNVSHESELLGTGGGIFEASRFLHNPNPVLVYNVDIWSDFNLKEFYHSHRDGDLATLACQKRESSRYLLVDEEMRVCGRSIDGVDKFAADPIGKTEKYGFSGIHVFSPQLWDRIPSEKSFSIIDYYLDMIEEGSTVRAALMEGDWFDVGTPEKLENLNHFLSGM